MLAPISGTRRDGGSSFRALKRYLGFKKDPVTGKLESRSELVISENLLSEETAQAEMRAVACENLRVKDPVYHYQLCWQEGERPTPEQWKAAAEKTVQSLGFKEHQYLIAPHTDTDHFHVHVMVNRVHPETYRAHYPTFSKRTLDEAIREIEHEQGWKESKGLFRWEDGKAIQNTREEMRAIQQERGADSGQKKRANKLETHTDTESLETYAKKEPAQAIAAVIKSGNKVSWAEIHAVLARHGLELEKGDKGGYTVRAVGTEIRVKASVVFRETFAGKENRARLETLEGWESKGTAERVEQLAMYKPPIQRDPIERTARREQRANERKQLKDEYQAYKAKLQAEQKVRWESGRTQRKAITVWHREQRSLIRGVEAAKTPAERKAELSLLAREVATDRAALEKQLREAREAAGWKSYRDWVTERAQQGDLAAVSQLRGFLYNEKRINSQSAHAPGVVIESADEGFRSTVVHPPTLANLRYRVDARNGDIRYSLGGKVLFIDQGKRISLFQEDDAAYGAALHLAQTKFGNRLHVTATDEKKRAIAQAAAQHSLQVEFTDERMNEWMRQAIKDQTAKAAEQRRREADREASKAEAARKAEEAKLIEPATTANAALVAIANRIEQGGTERVLVSRQEAAIFADAMFGVGLSGRLHGQGRGFNFLKNLEDGGRLPVGKTLRSDDLKGLGLANIEVSRTKTGFEYAITAIKDKVTEFVAYLRGAAASQLDWDTKVLKSRAKQIEQPSQPRQRKDNSLGK